MQRNFAVVRRVNTWKVAVFFYEFKTWNHYWKFVQYATISVLPFLILTWWHWLHTYMLVSGLHPMVEVTESQITYKADGRKAFQKWKGSSLKELSSTEPYLALSVAFLLFRASLYFFPGLVTRVVALWAAYIPHLNMGIFGDSRQILGRVFHVIDPKRAWSKLKLCKTRNFHKGARNARVWASSLTSVSLGETSAARIAPSGDL